MTASLHLIALMAMLTIVTSGLVTGQQARDHSDGLGVFDDALFRELFDDSDALRAERIAQDAQNLPAPGGHAFSAAHPALFDTHPGEPAERLLIGGRPGDGRHSRSTVA